MKNSYTDLLEHIHQEFNSSGGHLSLSFKEFLDYFQFKEEIARELIAELLSTGHYQFIKRFDFLLGKESTRLEIHPKYRQNYWLYSFLIPSEAIALLELGTYLEFPFNSRIKNLEIKDKHLVRLTIIEQKIGDLPSIIGTLKHLEVLKLQRCQLTSLPNSLGDLLNLKVLDLDYNKLSMLPEKIGELKNLQELWCRHNMLTTLPDSLGNLEKLKELSLEHNNFSSLPVSLCSLRNLSKLYLKGNPKLKSLPSDLQNLSDLKIHGLSDSRLHPSRVQLETEAQKSKVCVPHRRKYVSRDRMKDRYVLKFCISGSNFNLNCQLVRNTAEGVFSTNYMPTIGVDIVTKVITVNSREVKLILHTTVGLYFGKLRKFYYEGSVANIIIFDKSDPTSFALIPTYYQEYREIQGPKKPVAILGVITNSEKISPQEGQRLADQLGCLYVETHPSDQIQLPALYNDLTRIAFGESLNVIKKSTFSLIVSWFNVRLSNIRRTLDVYIQRIILGKEGRD